MNSDSDEKVVRLTHRNYIRSHALRELIFTLEDIRERFGDATAQSVYPLARAGEIRLQAQGVYSALSVPFGDKRATKIIKKVKARPLTVEQRATNEEAIDAAERKRLDADRKEASLTHRFEAFLNRCPVFIREDVAQKLGPGTYPIITRYMDEGRIRLLHSDIIARVDIDPDGPEVRDYAARHAQSQERITQEIDQYRELNNLPNIPLNDCRINFWSPKGNRFGSRIYIETDAYPTIYAYKGRGGYPGWRSKDGSLSPAAAEALGRRVFPDPILYTEMVRRVTSPIEQIDVQDRCGAYAPVPDNQFEHQSRFAFDDARSLNLAALGEKLTEPVDLFVDTAEPDSLFTLLTLIPNVRVFRQQLPVGDYVVPGRLIIERKTTDDLIQSLGEHDNRLSRQVHAMTEFEGKKVLLIEGDLYANPTSQVSLAKRLRVRSRLQYARDIVVTETLGQRGTAYEILLAILDTCDAEQDSAPMPKRAKSQTPYDIAIAMLRTVRGISLSKAQKIILECNDIAGVMALHPLELAELANISVDTAGLVYKALHGRTAPNRKPKLKVLKKA